MPFSDIFFQSGKQKDVLLYCRLQIITSTSRIFLTKHPLILIEQKLDAIRKQMLTMINMCFLALGSSHFLRVEANVTYN
jgi:hypothetical protein